MKKTLVTLLTLTLMIGLVGCGSTSADSSADSVVYADTLGNKYLQAFDNAAGTDAESVVEELIAVDGIPTELVKMEVVPGYLDGISEDVMDFNKGYRFSPMIGSIPFMGYVFEADDPEALRDFLVEHANTAWNICTMADETVSGVNNDLVFFLMCSNEES